MKNKKNIRVAFVSTSVSPYCITARQLIDNDVRIKSRHIFARLMEPGRQWSLPEVLPDSFQITRGLTVRLGSRFIYVPFGLPLSLLKFKPGVIVSEQLGTVLIFTLLYSLVARVPVLLRWEGTICTEKAYTRLFRNILREFLASKVDGFLCYSKGAEDYLKTLGVTKKMYLIPYSIDESVFYPPVEMSKRLVNVFLFVGQIVERKGLQLLLPAFYDVLKLRPQAELWVVGDGDLLKRLCASVPEQYIKNIKWLGFKNQHDIAELMRSVGNFVCPTLKDHGPVVQVEAIKTGLSIIASPYSGNAELVVVPGENGYIIDPHDRGGLTEAMVLLLDCKNRENMYKKSLKLASAQGSEPERDATVNAVLDLIDAT